MSHQWQALVVDDEPAIAELIQLGLRKLSINSTLAHTLGEAKHKLREKKFDFCFSDYRLPDGNGGELIQYCQKNFPTLPIAILTAYGSLEAAVQALKWGAFDFVSKPIDLTQLRTLAKTAIEFCQNETKPQTQTACQSQGLLGESLAIQQLKTQIHKVAKTQAPIYISGPSGAGKERVAREIHARSPRQAHPFVAVNCGAIPTELMESEFFGHKKGSFTGATSDKIGLFQAAEGGTLLLDEVADLPLNMQVKLLRAIQEKAIRRVGENHEFSIDVRLLTATHQNLATLVANQRFREDLYYRINVIELKVPCLSERTEDILPLANHFLNRLSGGPSFKLSDTAQATLMAYPFPGNVRELENIIERAFALSEGHVIQAEDLKLNAPTYLDCQADSNLPLEAYLDSIAKSKIIEALETHQGNKTAAAKALGLSFRALRYRLSKLGL